MASASRTRASDGTIRYARSSGCRPQCRRAARAELAPLAAPPVPGASLPPRSLQRGVALRHIDVEILPRMQHERVLLVPEHPWMDEQVLVAVDAEHHRRVAER